MDDCVFCKIVRGEIPCYKVYEDDDVLAFLDVSQTTLGHTLVISKNHYQNLLFVPKDILCKVMGAVQRVAQAQVGSLGAKGVNVINNTNEVAGQTVMHFHVHVIPRYSNQDKLRLEFLSNKIEHISLPAIAEEISKKL